VLGNDGVADEVREQESSEQVGVHHHARGQGLREGRYLPQRPPGKGRLLEYVAEQVQMTTERQHCNDARQGRSPQDERSAPPVPGGDDQEEQERDADIPVPLDLQPGEAPRQLHQLLRGDGFAYFSIALPKTIIGSMRGRRARSLVTV
jgi:hypothetical protein